MNTRRQVLNALVAMSAIAGTQLPAKGLVGPRVSVQGCGRLGVEIVDAYRRGDEAVLKGPWHVATLLDDDRRALDLAGCEATRCASVGGMLVMVLTLGPPENASSLLGVGYANLWKEAMKAPVRMVALLPLNLHLHCRERAKLQLEFCKSRFDEVVVVDLDDCLQELGEDVSFWDVEVLGANRALVHVRAMVDG